MGALVVQYWSGTQKHPLIQHLVGCSPVQQPLRKLLLLQSLGN